MTKETITSRNAVAVRTFAILCAISLAVMLSACSSSNNNNHTTTPPTVTLSSFPTSLYVNDTAAITATVTNDSTNAGVTWSCAPSGSCGTFSASSSASGTPVTYTAPAAVPSGTVTITATSKADSSVTANTSAVTINAASGITVSLSTPPPASMLVNATAPITATVAGDSANAGVTWSCAPAGSCGSFSASTSASGTAVTYTAPASAGSVTITATSVTDDAQMANANVTVTSSVVTTLAAGNYVFFVSGWDLIGNSVSTDANGNYTYAGAFTVDNTGAITGGEQDYNDDYYFSGAAEQITGGTVAATADGNLLITINSVDKTIGNGTGTIVLDASVVSSSKALLTEYDTWASGSGELDLQSTTLAAPTGGFAFYMSGLDINAFPIALGGVINVDGANTISGSGSVIDINDGGTLYPTQTLAANTSTVTSPDTFGYVRFEVNADCTQPTTDAQLCITNPAPAASLVTDGYMVDNNHIRLVENWHNDSLSAGIGGTALAQGSSTGTFGTGSISGNSYVVGLNGRDNSAYSFLQTAGVLTFTSGGTMGGNFSFNDIVAQSPQGGVAVTGGTYTVSATGDVTVTGATDGATFSTNLQLYLTGDGHALVISMDATDAVSGFGWQQTTSTLNAASLTGPYGLDLTESAGGLEQDAVGAFNSNGSNTLTGFYDLNGTVSVGALASDQTFQLTYAATSTNGVFNVTGGGSTLYTSYLIDGTHGVVIENDNSQLSLGYFEQQQ